MTKQVAVIIGGTSGIGLETGIQLAKNGLRVLVTGRDKGKVDTVMAESPMIEAQVVDAVSSSSLRTFYESIGAFNHLVLCVSGAKGAGEFSSLSEDDVREGMEQKFFAQLRAAQLALPHLDKAGSLTFVSAISARAANPGTAGLAAINGAIESMVKPLARELRPLRVNAVSPGVVETPWWDRLPADVRGPLLERSAAATLVGKNGTASQLADAICFVVCNGFVAGTILEVDGGLRLS